MPRERPNILLVTSDQQRYDTAGPAAPSFMRTPHFDFLSREGITFSAAYADCPICVPARVSLMTGQYVFTHRMARNGSTSLVLGREGTLPSLLRALGYQTAAIGKMHFGPRRTRHGFDEMILPADYYRAIRRSGSVLQPMRHGLGQTELHPSMATVPESLTLTSWIAEQCVEYIVERRDPSVPFFLWCSFTKPHPPLDPPEPYYSMYRECPIPEPVYGDWSSDERCPEVFKRTRQRKSVDLIPPEIIREARAAYLGLITQLDYAMGRVLGALRDSELLDDTLIVYLSDHGEYLGDHHTASKIFFHEPSAHIPLVVRLPRSWENRCHGTTVQFPVTHADILPTLVTAAGGRAHPGVEGQDLITLARDQLPQPRQFLHSTVALYSPCDFLGVTDGRWKYIWYPEGAAEQLFDLRNDPQELRDLAALTAFAGQREALRDELVDWLLGRESEFVQHGALITRPISRESVADRRGNGLYDFRTDYCELDQIH